MSLTRPKSGIAGEPAGLAAPAVSAPRQPQRSSDFAHRGGAARPSIQLHIEELVLHGFSPHDRHRIAEAVEAELHRLLDEQGLALLGQREHLTMERLDAGAFTTAPGASAGSLGAQVAQSVYRASAASVSSRPENHAISNGR